eukprot:1194042-Prorocentrum_minimum.AAC.5
MAYAATDPNLRIWDHQPDISIVMRSLCHNQNRRYQPGVVLISGVVLAVIRRGGLAPLVPLGRNLLEGCHRPALGLLFHPLQAKVGGVYRHLQQLAALGGEGVQQLPRGTITSRVKIVDRASHGH